MYTVPKLYMAIYIFFLIPFYKSKRVFSSSIFDLDASTSIYYSCTAVQPYNCTAVLLSSWAVGNWRIAPARRPRAGFCKLREKIHASLARGARARVWRDHDRIWPWPDVSDSLARWDHRKLKFGLRQGIKLNKRPKFCFIQLDNIDLVSVVVQVYGQQTCPKMR